MHHDHIEALHTVRDLGLRLKADDVAAVDVSVHPPFTDLRTVQTLVEKEHIPVALGAQHCSDEDAGALTGEVSPAILGPPAVRLRDRGPLGAPHSSSGWTTPRWRQTLRAVLRHAMTPIVCVGESEERETGGTTERVRARSGAGVGRGEGGRPGEGRGGLRADLGDRHRPDGDGGGRRRDWRRSARRSPGSTTS